MAINWFPGHMHKARKEMKKVLSGVDVVIEVLDARIPFSSANPMLRQLRGDKPCIKLLNKADLADAKATETWQRYLEQEQSVKTLAITAQEDAKGHAISNLCFKLAPNKKDGDRKLTAMVAGIPNVGKSTLINALAGRSVAKVGNEPAVTKRQQKIHLNDDLSLLDTPGILWPKLEPEACGYRLAATGAVKDTAMEYEDVALFTLSYLVSHYPEQLAARYKLGDGLPQSEDEAGLIKLLETIGSKRGCLRAGGHVDLYQASSVVLRELRAANIGPITLETPELVEAELAEFREMIARKRAEEEAKELAKEGSRANTRDRVQDPSASGHD